MFYLRRTLTDWTESNLSLGDDYGLIRYTKPDDAFCVEFENLYGFDYRPEGEYDESYEKHLCMAWYHSCMTEAFVVKDELTIPICPLLPAYIMTGAGKTFDRLNSMCFDRLSVDPVTGEVAPTEWVEYAEKKRSEEIQEALSPAAQ
jgi:hypothetical protein